MEPEILMTKRLDEVSREEPKGKLIGKIVLAFEALGKPIKIHIEFKDPVVVEETPVTIVEDEDSLLQNLEAEIWVKGIQKVDEVAYLENDEESESDEEDD